MDGAANQKWMSLLRDYMIKHHINHTFWCLNPNSGDTGGLLDTQFSNWDEAKYGLFEESLWQTLSSGKYIGLDHQTALGENGLSLTDFYSNYASTEGSNLDGGTKGSGHTEPVTDPTTDPTTVGPTGLWGDADCNGEVKMNDVVLVMQSIANQDKYGLTGSDSEHITADGQKLANVVDPANTGLTVQDALQIQKFLLEMITDLTPNAK